MDRDENNPDRRRSKRGPYRQWLDPESEKNEAPRTTAKRLRRELCQGGDHQAEQEPVEAAIQHAEPDISDETAQPSCSHDAAFDCSQSSPEHISADNETAPEQQVPMTYYMSDNESEQGDRDEDESGSDSEEHIVNPGLEALKEAIEGNLFNAISTDVVCTAGDILLGVLQVATKHKLNNQCVLDIVNLVNSIFKQPILPSTQFSLDKLLFSKNSMHFYFYCTNCFEGFGEISNFKTVKVMSCPNCKKDNTISDLCKAPNYVLVDLDQQLELLLNEFWEKLYDPRVQERDSNGELSDIYDGEIYQNFQSSLHLNECNTKFISLTACTDGCPVFSSSNHDIWPLSIMVNELPPSIRMKNVLLAGLWFGEKKPAMDLFMHSFAMYLEKLEHGIPLTIKGEKVIFKIYLLGGCMDSPARAAVQGLMQFNGEYGCAWCYHPGIYEGHARMYPFNEDDLPVERTHVEIVTHASEILEIQEADARRKRAADVDHVKGVKYLSALAIPKFFNLVSGMIVEYLHAALLGVAKFFCKKWLEVKGPWYIGEPNLLFLLNKKLCGLAPVIEVRRLPRKLTDYPHFKAREWENWILYYSLPVLQDVLPEMFLRHWALFVESMHLLLKDKVSLADIQKADQLIKQFVKDVVVKYEDFHAATYNVHLITHFPVHCKRWGPLWAVSSFAFEDHIGKLKNLLPANRGIPNQICRSLSHSNAIQLLKQTAPLINEQMKLFISQVKNPHFVEYTHRVGDVRLFGSSKPFVGTAAELWLCDQNNVVPDMCVTYRKAIFKSMTITTYNANRSAKSDNSTVKLNNGEILLTKKIVLCNETNTPFILGSIVNHEPLMFIGTSRQPSSVRKVTSVYDEISFAPLSRVKSVASCFKDGHTIKFVVPMPYVVNTN